jgi:prepilin-type N-terminal cleavage/methylation domain-containing protein
VNKMMKKIMPKLKKGFTIIESLVAIAILMVAIVGPMTAAQRGLAATTIAQDQMVANYLAQDALEYIFYIKEWEAMQSPAKPFMDNIRQCTIDSPCTLETVDLDIFTDDPNDTDGAVQTLSGSNSKLYVDINNRYTHKSTNHRETNFSRYFYAERPISAPDQYMVTVVVSWNTGQFSNEVVVNSWYFNR